MFGFDIHLKKCVSFVYTGCGGNENSFFSKKQCNSVCGIKVDKSVCQMVVEDVKCHDGYIKR